MHTRIPLFLAAHEAGHAVALIVLSPEHTRPFNDIEVGFDFDDKPMGRVSVGGRAKPSPFDRAVIAMAGPIAEARIRHRRLRRGSDYQTACESVGEHEMIRVTASGRTLVRSYWPAVYWLARNLQIEHCVDYHDALLILHSAMEEGLTRRSC